MQGSTDWPFSMARVPSKMAGGTGWPKVKSTPSNHLSSIQFARLSNLISTVRIYMAKKLTGPFFEPLLIS